MGFERTLLAAQGYLELGMASDALAELETLPLESMLRPDVVKLCIGIALEAEAWEAGLKASRRLCALEPEDGLGFIHAAFCLHELGCTADAKATLLAGPPALAADATFHYNLGCYHACLGAIDEARASLGRAFELDEKFREFAQTDTDLAALHGALD